MVFGFIIYTVTGPVCLMFLLSVLSVRIAKDQGVQYQIQVMYLKTVYFVCKIEINKQIYLET